MLTETIAAAILPSIASYPAVSLGISATAVPFFVQPLTLVDTLTRELSFGGDGEIAIIHEPGSGALMVGDVAEEMFQGTGLASVVDMGRLVIHTHGKQRCQESLMTQIICRKKTPDTNAA